VTVSAIQRLRDQADRQKAGWYRFRAAQDITWSRASELGSRITQGCAVYTTLCGEYGLFEEPFEERPQRQTAVMIARPWAKRLAWLAALWLRLLGGKDTAHAIFAREAPVVVGQTYLRPGVWWPRVVTMRYVAPAPSGWGRFSITSGPPRLMAWRERRAGLCEGLRVHAKMRLR